MIFNNLNLEHSKPKRVVILGSNGFIAKNLISDLEKNNIEIIKIPKEKIDLTQDNANERLSSLLSKNDVVVFTSAKAPVKEIDTLIKNLKMAKSLCNCISNKQISHLIYISSDAVYKDSKLKLNELSCAEPSTLHGVMHLSREIMIKNYWKGPLCIVRPTMIYGIGDPHNGYGPNSFLKLAKKNQNINLFGKGEELRDHVYIKDVANILKEIILYKTVGVLNIASGNLISFNEIADLVVESLNSNSKIIYNQRIVPMPHNGYRPFDISIYKKFFNKYKFNTIENWLKRINK